MRFPPGLGALLFVSSTLLGCGGESPTVSLVATPSSGVAPLTTRLDASGSREPEGRALVFRFDLDGDGTFETDFSSEPTYEGTIAESGSYRARVEVRVAEVADGDVAASEAAIEVKANQAPVARLSLTPLEGKSPLLVRLDASASSDPDEGPETLTFRFDVDGDGDFDTEAASTAAMENTYRSPGRFSAMVEVRDRQGLVSVASVDGPNVLASADIAVDSNRDGQIDQGDELDEETWSRDRGAVFLANLDDDDGDGERDGREEVYTAGSDALDLTPVLVRQNDQLSDNARVTLTVSPAEGAASVRIFIEDPDGSHRVLLAPNAASAEISAALLRQADAKLWLEGLRTRVLGWDGHVTLTLRVEDGAEVDEDVVALRVSPVIFQDNILEPYRLYLMRISDNRLGQNLPFYNAVRDNLPETIELYDVDQYRYEADRWVQDTMQTGYQSMPGPNGTHQMQTYLATERLEFGSSLQTLIPQELLRPDLGYFYPGRSVASSLNYGGNLEVAPPHSADGVDYPFGRIVVGGGRQGTLMGVPYSDGMGETQRAWLDAQEVQGPSLQYSTEWLAVGHVDEIFLFVPNRAAAEGERAWKLMIASPDLARLALSRLVEQGQGDLPVFLGRETQATVAAILNDPGLTEFNRRAQIRIDGIRDGLAQALGLTDQDIIEVPVMYEYYDFDGYDLAAAYNPGIQNLMVAGSTLFIPDPEGPEVEGVDVWKRMTREVTEPLGVTSIFVDIFESYHLNLGEAHCGTEFDTAPFPTHWWEVAQ